MVWVLVTSQSSNKRRGCMSASVGKQTPIKLTMFKCLQHSNFTFCNSIKAFALLEVSWRLWPPSPSLPSLCFACSSSPQPANNNFALQIFSIQTVSLHRYILLKLKQSIFSKSYPHLLIPQPLNWAPAWACPCRPCHRRPCPGSGPCREGPLGRCLCCGTWTTCWCVVALLMGLVLLRKAKVTKLSWNQFRFVKALTT